MQQIIIKHFFFYVMLIFIMSCGTMNAPYYSENAREWVSNSQKSGNKLIHSLYLVGGAGKSTTNSHGNNEVLDAMVSSLKNETVETSLVFLGNNISPKGLPKKEDPDRNFAEKILLSQLQVSKSHGGKTYFIPGNQDWNGQDKGGRKAILRQEKFIKAFDKGNKNANFFPQDACGDPKVVKINKDLVFVFLDSQWWLQDWSVEKNMNRKCDIKSRQDLLKRIEEIFVDHKNDEIVVMLHHPIKSNGNRGGKFNLKQHIFPFTELNKNLFIPLPIIGSIYPIQRNVVGTKQDISNINNQNLMQGIDKIAKGLRINVIFASGQDAGLQYFNGNKIKYIVSGSGSEKAYIQKGGSAIYSRSALGFAKINFYKNNESWLEIYTVSENKQGPVLEYRAQLRSPRQGTVEEDVRYPPITEASKIIAANEKFAAGSVKKFFLGSQYRDIWATPVIAEVIDLETKLGGLTPIKKGGGMASNSLRMEIENGKQYILRSIKKDYTKLVPPGFGNLKLIDLLADQNSASHPYNALAIPTLSKAAGVFYTDPKLVYLKHQRGLGNYNSQFPEELYLLEERPSGDWSDAAQFGNSSDIIGYTDLLETLREKKNHFIDQEWVLKSRMFDLFIHDWDRHDDQWRWAKFEEDDKNVYRPIPRDRDQAFYKFKGVVPWYIATFMIKKFKTMKGDVKDVKNLAFNAQHFDRYFLHDLEWSEWETVIHKMQHEISDDDIENATRKFPSEIMSIKDVSELAVLLKERRANLKKIGKRLYDFLSAEVEITGTDNKDRFEIEQLQNGNLHIKYFVERKEKGDLLKYDRTFYPSETNEVRLYGLRGKDKFIITGVKNNDITLRIIGGEDDDSIENKTTGRKVYAYDDLKGIELSGQVINKTSNNLDVNEYDRKGFKYNTSFPIVTFGNTVDDGFWIGGSISWTTQGWRKDPYKSKQSLSISLAPGSQNAYQVAYHGHYPNSFGNLDFAPRADVHFPQYQNYFGLGGNTTNPLREIQYHWVRMENIDIEPMFRINISKSSHLDFGPTFRYRNIENTQDRITEDDSSFFTSDVLDARNYLGGTANYNFGYVDNAVFPTNGFGFTANATHIMEPSKDEQVTEFSLETQLYVQLLTRPKLVFANNFGYMSSYGNRQFYHYPSLGNNKGLRGFRNERYRGSSVLYNNIDVRVKLFKWSNNFIPMDIGLLGGYDFGKIYLDDGLENPWQSSQTVGIWFELLGAMILQPYYSFNNEQNTFSLQVGFNF